MKPILCNYYLTYRCNGKCVFCEIWQHAKYQKTKDANVEQVFQNLVELKKIGIRFIDFTGGEPLLYQELPAVLSTARRLGFFTSVTTNGYFYASLAEPLKGLVDFLHFSLDSMEKTQNDTLRGQPFFERVIENVKIARALNEKPDILFTVTENNYQQIEPLRNYCAANQLILIVNPVFGYGNVASLKPAILKYLDNFRNKPFIYLNRAFQRFRQQGGNQIQQPRCRAMSSTIVISPDNKILAPCFHHAIAEIPIETSIQAILKAKSYSELKSRQGQFPFCQGCVINCYLDPSFTHHFDRYWWLSTFSKAKYVFDKYIRPYFTSQVNS